jgi:hypothetical protein
MKTQVIQLDPHDDVISIRDKMSWSKSERILLVLPRGSAILKRPLDMQLLARHAVRLGAQVALVTKSSSVRENAQKFGIPVFRVVKTAQRKAWEIPPEVQRPARRTIPVDLLERRLEILPVEQRWRTIPGVRIAFFSLAILAVVILLLLFFPSATIRLAPQTQLQELALSINASPTITSVNLTGSIPASTISTVVEKKQVVDVTGSIKVPDMKAAGKVLFRNLTNETIGIPAGTIVQTNGNQPIRFVTTIDAVMAGPAGKTAEVNVRALEAGSQGNLDADVLVAIEGNLGASLTVTNPAPIGGGTDIQKLAPSESDRRNVYQSLQREILADCRTTLQEKLEGYDLAFPDTLEISQVLSETYFPAPNQAGDSLTLTLNVKCQMQYAAGTDIDSFLETVLDLNISPGYETGPGSEIAMVAEIPVTDADGSTEWHVHAQRTVRVILDKQAAVRLAQGRQREQAAQRIFTAMELESLPEIEVKPAWWPWVPLFPFRISVVVGD